MVSMFHVVLQVTTIKAHTTDTYHCRGYSEDARYVARSSLMSGAIASLSQPGGPNSSYVLKFWGTTLECETHSRTGVRTFYGPDVGGTYAPDLRDAAWGIQNFVSNAVLMTNVRSLEMFGKTTIIYRTSEYLREYRYYPCLDNANRTSSEERKVGHIALPRTGIHFLVPFTDTVCHPVLKRYSVTVSSDTFGQHISSSFDDDEYIPAYTSDFKSFNGSYELWVHFSDALSIYNEFAASLNVSFNKQRKSKFPYDSASTRSAAYTLRNGTIVETCTLQQINSSLYRDDHPPELWPLSVFERRLPANPDNTPVSKFDVEMANELLINTTISTMALGRRWGIANGTGTRTFNIFRFKNKLAFFLPYGLSIALGIPIIALGLLSFYVHNQGTSAISGGFLQLLVTTTGRTGLEDMVIKHSATTGGYENVSDELKAVEVRLGELIEVGADEQDGRLASSDSSSEQVGDIEVTRQDDSGQDNGAETASVVDTLEKNEPGSGRFGFGLAHEVRPLRRRNV
jgi:hypothetical protein